jgi:small subunit ribosomal protein S2
MKKFIFTARSGIYIIDLKKTVERIDKAYRLIVDRVAAGGLVLFVGTKKQAKEAVTSEAQRCGMPYVTERWLGGMLTNFQTIRRSLKRLEEIEKMATDGSFEKFTKKEVLKLEKERKKLDKNLGGIREMSRLPGVVFVVDTKKERIAVAEANRLDVPIVAILDTNSDPDVVNFPVPGNDDAIKSIRLISRIVADAVLDGKEKGGISQEKEPEPKGEAKKAPEKKAAAAAERTAEKETEKKTGRVAEKTAEKAPEKKTRKTTEKKAEQKTAKETEPPAEPAVTE